MKALVVDASIIIKWFIVDDEGDREQAVRLRDAIAQERLTALAPGLALYEVGNTLGRRIPEDAPLAMSALQRMPLRLCSPEPEEIERGLTLVREHGVTFYDAVYHAMALHREGQLITADRRYIDRVAATGSATLLADWSPT
ncbi:type II toxin-antitoxin system VapC family toxin [Algiphilus sp.]|uniref:type II toxin-antitoxin system VapC family toxin n=1 Tax=Algiphilus sp. TaxID=1872431 RepID=UPI0025BAC096|nr:type II toxin-antitoxin system VapC family toxin [Algiphilus sp.]MCK5771083.1 type II toxin-antitoxin system VapC family toxin [Algiphilus sp.]